MSFLLYILIGIVIGGIFVYVVLKLSFQKRMSVLEMASATKISKEEIARDYVSKDLYFVERKTLEETNKECIEKQKIIDKNQIDILKLTTEVAEKFSRKEIEEKYVHKESFDIINEKLTLLTINLSEKNAVILNLNKEIATIEEKEKSLNERIFEFRQEIEKLHVLTKEQFKNIANDILEEKKRLFVETNKTEINTILDPLKTDITNFKKSIEDTRKEDIKDMTSLKHEIDSLQKLNIQLSDDAQNLANALKSDVKIQGNWGEDRLNLILETEGLQKHIDYTNQEVYRDDEEDINRKPDLILSLPNNKHIIIDSKVSLTAYVNYFNATNPGERAECLKLHLKSVIDHIDLLAAKNYQSLSGLTTPDYVFLFMPIEGAMTLALNNNSEIFNRALKKKIVIITPTTLVATLKIVKIIWQKENQVKNVEEIFRQCGALYDKFVTYLDEMDKVGNGLSIANKSFKDAMESLKDGTRRGHTIIGRFEAIKKLEAKTNKSIPDKYIAGLDILNEEEEVRRIDIIKIDEITPKD